MSLFAKSRNVRLFGTSILAQMLLSFGNFVIGFLLIRHTTDFDYGLFVLVQSAILLAVTTQGAWVSPPLSVIAPHKPVERRLVMIGSIERSLRRYMSLLGMVALIVPIFCYLHGTWNGTVTMVVVLGILAGWVALLRDYVRGILLLFSRPQTMLYADVVYVVIMVCGALLAAFGPGQGVLWAVGALMLAGGGGWLVGYYSVKKDPGWYGRAPEAGPFWAEIRRLGIWSAVGSVIYWLYAQSYSYILASRLDLTAVADVNAARLLLMPSVVLATGIKSQLLPLAATWLAKDGVGPMLRRTWLVVPVVALMNFFYMAVVWLGRDFITTDLMHKVIHDREVLLVMWAVIVLLALIRDMLQGAVLVLGRFQSLTWLSAASALVALPMMWFCISLWGAVGALIGQACGEAVSLVGVLLLLPRVVARYKQQNATA